MTTTPTYGRLPLFDDLPDGFHYGEEFISIEEEHALLGSIARVEFSNFEMRGAIARRRVVFFGDTYSRSGTAAQPLPAFLFPIRARIAAWAGRSPEAFAMVLINEYPPGAPIGWHRDAPQYEDVAGLSLGSACRMRFRRYVSAYATVPSDRTPRRATHEIALMPRSAYLMTGPSRRDYEHSIPPVESLRYSVTFRSLRSRARSR